METPKKSIQIGKGQFEKILSIINNNEYHLEETTEDREEENIPFKKTFGFSFEGMAFLLLYVFRQPNCFDPNWAKHIYVIVDMNPLKFAMENIIKFYLYENRIVFEKDNSTENTNTISAFNKLLKMA